MTQLESLREFLQFYFDDYAVCGEGDGAFVHARTVRAWSALIGGEVFDRELQRLVEERTLRILGDYRSAQPEEYVLELLFYA